MAYSSPALQMRVLEGNSQNLSHQLCWAGRTGLRGLPARTPPTQMQTIPCSPQTPSTPDPTAGRSAACLLSVSFPPRVLFQLEALPVLIPPPGWLLPSFPGRSVAQRLHPQGALVGPSHRATALGFAQLCSTWWQFFLFSELPCAVKLFQGFPLEGKYGCRPVPSAVISVTHFSLWLSAYTVSSCIIEILQSQTTCEEKLAFPFKVFLKVTILNELKAGT